MFNNLNINGYYVASCYGSTGREISFLERIRQRLLGLQMPGKAQELHYTHRQTVSKRTTKAEGVDAATSTLFPTWL